MLIDERKCRHNIRRMADRALQHNIRLRPHFKTHQSRQIAAWFREAGTDCITVSSLRMAEYFAADAWDDITVAFPVNTREHERINRLAERISLNLLVAGSEGAGLLSQVLHYPVGVWIKIDAGTRRTGVLPDDRDTINVILDTVKASENMSFRGFLTHAGHSYSCRSRDEILRVHRESAALLAGLAADYRSAYPLLEVSTGDTPTCSVADDFTNVDEIRPGNYVFNDLMQAAITSCSKQDIAVAVACPVVAKHNDRNEIILYGGAIHFAKDSIVSDGGITIFGELVQVSDDGWSEPLKGCYLSKLSQEHGTLKVTDEVFRQINVGDMVAILPVHSCMTANLLAGYTTLGGDRLEYFDIRKEYMG
ncbi:MAG: alanine racemase [Bacteroidales bacterium]|nr:alanine racemase [Bacteroidales bacterium]